MASPGTDRTEADSGAEVPTCSLRYSLWTARRRPPSTREGALPGPHSPPPRFSLLSPSRDPGSSPQGSARLPATGPLPLWPRVEAARSRSWSRSSGGRGPFKEPRCGNPSPQSGRAGARQRDLWDGSPAPLSISRAGSGRRQPSGPAGGVGARNPAVRSRRVHGTLPGTRGTGDAVCRARRRAGAPGPAGPPPGLAWPGLRRPGSSRARGAEAAPAGACGCAASSGPWAAQGGTWPAAPAHPDAFVHTLALPSCLGYLLVSGQTGGCFAHPGKPSWWSLVYSQVHQVGKSSLLLLLLLNKTRSFYSSWRCSSGSHF